MSLNVPKVNLLLPNCVRCLICFVYQSVVQLKGDLHYLFRAYMSKHPMKHRITNTSCGSIPTPRSECHPLFQIMFSDKLPQHLATALPWSALPPQRLHVDHTASEEVSSPSAQILVTKVFSWMVRSLYICLSPVAFLMQKLPCLDDSRLFLYGL